MSCPNSVASDLGCYINNFWVVERVSTTDSMSKHASFLQDLHCAAPLHSFDWYQWWAVFSVLQSLSGLPFEPIQLRGCFHSGPLLHVTSSPWFSQSRSEYCRLTYADPYHFEYLELIFVWVQAQKQNLPLISRYGSFWKSIFSNGFSFAYLFLVESFFNRVEWHMNDALH